MKDAGTLSAAQTLWAHWRDGSTLENLSGDARPATRAEGYAIQVRLTEVAGQSVSGWKIAATSKVGQAHINVSGPLAGRLLASQILEEGATVPSFGNRMRVAEPEMAFTLGKALGPRATAYAMDEVMAAVATLHPALEMPNSRFAKFTAAGEAQLVADCACAHHFMLGTAASDEWRKLDLSKHKVHVKVTKPDGSTWTRDGIGEAVLGDPRIAMTWIVNELTSQGLTLDAGLFFTTGTCMAPIEIEPGDLVEAEFGVLGKISMKFGE